ncbi:DUF6541 family protein [Pseudonocardia sp. CA-107938]|uniref:DUF6541 family protein n=1 Tax=Pseudonocardia sp. CA-107938 TaxID=3240021 RepID=UPI003D8CAF65
MPEALGDPVLLVYAALTLVPGLALAAAAGLRGWLLAALAPLLTYGLVGAAAPVLPMLGIRWSPTSFGVLTALAAAVALLLRVVARRRRPAGERAELPAWTPLHHVGVAIGVLVASVVGIAVAWGATRGFTAVPQIWDAMFHANATRFIAETGRSDPSALATVSSRPEAGFYYPNAYHALAATVVLLTGADVPTVLDASTALAPGLLALGMAGMVRRLGGRPALAAAAAMLSAAFTAFPYDLLPWGTLLPFIVAVALLPAFLAAAATALDGTGAPVAVPVLLGIGGIGLLALHPSGAVTAVLLAAALVLDRWVRRRPRMTDLRAAGVTVLSAAVLGAPLLAASVAAAAGPAYDWPANARPAQVLGELLFLSHAQEFPQWWLVALMLAGLVGVRRLRPVLWFLGVAAVFAALFVLTASYEGTIVAVLTRPWWNDRWRFAAIWTLGAIVLAAGGVVTLRDGLMAVLQRFTPREERARLAVSAVALTLVLAAVTFLTSGFYHVRNASRMAEGFTDGPSLSRDEEQAVKVLAGLAPPGSLVMNDPYDGSSMMWAVAGVHPVFATPVIKLLELPVMDPDRRLLFTSFNQLDTNPDVRRAVEKLDVQYVFVGTGLIPPADGPPDGMLNLDRVRSLERVYTSAEATIYRVGPAPAPGRS